jgi:carbon-monoxide dehydrogenase medium subunit
MMLWKDYHLAESIPDALQALDNATGVARLIAGGTDLLLDLQQGRHPPVDTLVDITRIPEMNSLDIHNGVLYIGAGLPLNHLVNSPLLFQNAQALYEACKLIGGPQVRNTATLGGNVAHALPAADGTIALLAFDAKVEIASIAGRKIVPLGELFLGPGKSALDPKHEILVAFHLPLAKARQASAFRRVMRPQGVAIAILNMAVWIERDDFDGKGQGLKDIRIALGPGGPTPFRARGAEDVLRGSFPSSERIESALEVLLEEVVFRTSPHRATQKYRRRLAGVLLEETLGLAWERAGMEIEKSR